MMKEVDFLPESFHQARIRRRLVRRNVVYSLVLLVGFASLHLVKASQLRSAHAALTDLSAGDQPRSLLRGRLRVLQNRKRALQDRLDLVNRLDDDAPLDVAVAEITAQMSDSMAIRSLLVETTAPDGVDADKCDPLLDRGPTRVVLDGVAVDDVQVGSLWGRLDASPLFDRVKLSFCDGAEEAGRRMRKFQLVFDVRRVALSRVEPASSRLASASPQGGQE
jgi:hypothetical protein